MAKIPNSIPINFPIAPADSDSTNGTHFSSYGIGGIHHVISIVERDAITPDRRVEGMLCTVKDDGSGSSKIYQLVGGIDNENWKELESGSPTVVNGKSAYDIAKELNPDIGTEAEWIASLKGETGQDGKDGENGKDGKSAYELALAANPTIGTEAEWLASLKGQDGQNGQDGQEGATGANGKSAYEVAVDNGFTGTEAEWLESLKGQGSQSGGSFNSDNLTATAYSVSAAPLTGGGLAYVVKVARLNADSNTELFSVKNGGICCNADGYVRVTGVYTIASSVPAGIPDYAGIYIARNDDDVYSPNAGSFYKKDTTSTMQLTCNGLLKVSANDIVYLKGSARTDCNVGSAAMCINYIGGAILKSEGTSGGVLSTYPTVETATGKTWIDGKPIYCIAIDTITTNKTSVWNVLATVPDVENVISLNGVFRTSNGYSVPLNFMSGSSTIISLSYNHTESALAEWHSDASYNNKPLRCIFEYTKV